MSTLLLNHFNGTDGATTFTDEIGGITWSRRGSPYGGGGELDTATKKLGSASLLLPNASAAADTVEGSGFSSPHAASYTAETFLRISGSVGSAYFYLNDASDNFQIAVSFLADTQAWTVDVLDSSSNSIFNDTGGVTIASGTWYHAAFVRDSGAGTYALYFNGTRISVGSVGTNARTFDRVDLQNGSSIDDTSFDETRLTNEVKYSGSTYVVPTAEFNSNEIDTKSAEFDHSSSSAALTRNAVALSSEYGYEAPQTALTGNLGVQSAEFAFEVTPSRIQTGTIPFDAEFGREFGNASLSFTALIEAQSAEFGKEWGFEPLIDVAGPEMGWEADSPDLTALQILSEVHSAEFDWEEGSVRLRHFIAGIDRPRRIEAGRRSENRVIRPQAYRRIDIRRAIQ